MMFNEQHIHVHVDYSGVLHLETFNRSFFFGLIIIFAKFAFIKTELETGQQ